MSLNFESVSWQSQQYALHADCIKARVALYSTIYTILNLSKYTAPLVHCCLEPHLTHPFLLLPSLIRTYSCRNVRYTLPICCLFWMSRTVSLFAWNATHNTQHNPHTKQSMHRPTYSLILSSLLFFLIRSFIFSYTARTQHVHAWLAT